MFSFELQLCKKTALIGTDKTLRVKSRIYRRYRDRTEAQSRGISCPLSEFRALLVLMMLLAFPAVGWGGVIYRTRPGPAWDGKGAKSTK